MGESGNKRLFWACFISLIATAFGFIIRALIIDEWANEFNFSETQKGELFGVGLWPFAISIVLFSLIVDKIGYGTAMAFAFACHIVSAIITITATGYWSLYVGTFIVALGNGTVEAVINPVVATIFAKEKTKWLNILHAGWPGGLVLGGLLMIAMSENGWIGAMVGKPIGWQLKVALIFLPVVTYGVMLIGCKFPVNERVAAGSSYEDMLKEFGILSALVVTPLIVGQLGEVFGVAFYWQLAVMAVLVLAFAAYVRALGRPMLFFLMLVMIPLATTELGTDSWMTDLLGPAMRELGLQAGWVLVYTSAIMMVLRFFAGPIVHKMSPLGLLAASSIVAALGLVSLSQAQAGMMILAAATLYGFGKTFFWPTMLGVVAERFPKGGALTLNAMGGVGMLGVGVVGAALLGNLQDSRVVNQLAETKPEIHSQVIGDEKSSLFGSYIPVETEKVNTLPEEQRNTVHGIQAAVKKDLLTTVAIFPVIMFVCYIALILYFKTQGGYSAEVLTGHAADDEKFTGGVPGPVE